MTPWGLPSRSAEANSRSSITHRSSLVPLCEQSVAAPKASSDNARVLAKIDRILLKSKLSTSITFREWADGTITRRPHHTAPGHCWSDLRRPVIMELCKRQQQRVAAEADACEAVDGLTLYPNAIDASHQAHLVELVESVLTEGKCNMLIGKTYKPPTGAFVQRNQSRDMLQFGVYTHSNRVEDTPVAPLPSEFEELVSHLISQGVMDSGLRPNACTVNIYETGHWIPPHIDSTKFARPFYTVSLLSEQATVFSQAGLSPTDAGGCGEQFEQRIMLPTGSVLCVDGAAADVWQHAVPPVSERRISLTFRRLTDEAQHQFDTARSERELAKELRTLKRANKKPSRNTLKRGSVHGDVGLNCTIKHDHT